MNWPRRGNFHSDLPETSPKLAKNDPRFEVMEGRDEGGSGYCDFHAFSHVLHDPGTIE